MCGHNLQRISELRNYSISLRSATAYFQHDDKFSNPQKRKFFVDIECDLQKLDAGAWDVIRGEACKRLLAQDPARGWSSLFEALNEAKGYSHLVCLGCTDVKFIPRSTIKGQRTPDLQGLLASSNNISINVLCEVKTINASQPEVERRINGGVGRTLLHLEEGFFRKLFSDIETATNQMRAYDPNVGTRRIVYLVVSFDDILNEYAVDYQKQIEACVACETTIDVEVFLDIKPPFYSAGGGALQRCGETYDDDAH